MNILPQKYSHFREKNYWDHFFSALKNTKDQFFQWYGDYRDYRFLLQLSLRESKRIFHVGCGKSTFAEDLHADYPNIQIINCDYSQQVIEEMQERTKNLKLQGMAYQVVDLLEPLSEKYQGCFDLVLDKGTLDAMLPEDGEQNVKRIKQRYFPNIQQALNKQNEQSKIIIISLLQPFVLRTLLQHFSEKSFSIDIYECLLKDSKLQPFMIALSPFKKPETMVTLHLLNSESQGLKNQTEVSEAIKKLQHQVQMGGNIKRLSSGRRTKYNIYNQTGNKALRYIVQIIDSEQKQILSQNNCSVFVVPQGKEHSYLFDVDEGIKQLGSQIRSARLILAKLVTGNSFDNLDQVKKQLNEVLPDLIQDGCDPKKVPYLTDGDSLGRRQYLFENQEFIIDEVLVDQEPYRRFFLKSNVILPQCQTKLAQSSTNSPAYGLAKGVNSKILPFKRNMFTGIDRLVLADDNAQIIYSGISCFLGFSRLKKNGKVLIFGFQAALAKFIVEYGETVQVTMVVPRTTGRQICEKYLELAHSQYFQIINSTPEAFFQAHPQDSYDVIVLADNQSEKGMNPSPNYLTEQFLTKILEHLEPAGLFMCQIWDYEWIPNLSNHFFPVYASRGNSKESNILFGLRYGKQLKQVEEKQVVIVPEILINPKPKFSKAHFEWEIDHVKDFLMIQPDITDKQHGGFIVDKAPLKEDPYALGVQKKPNKNKKKKKR